MENSFSKRRAEDFNNDYLLLAHIFAKPHFWTNLQGRNNFFLIGSRGSGKSMILRNMSAESEAARIQSPEERADETSPFIGVYLKVHTGTFMPLKPEKRKYLNEEELSLFFGHFFNMTVGAKILRSLNISLSAHGIKIPTQKVLEISQRIAKLSGMNKGLSSIKTFSDLTNSVFEQELQEVRRLYVSLKTPGSKVKWKKSLTDVSTFLDEMCEILRDTISWIKDKRFYILIDEYEHLHDYQQRSVNTLIKHRPSTLSFKVAARQMGIRTYSDNMGEELQDPDDYTQQTLDYNLADDRQRSLYENLLSEIFRARLKHIGSGYRVIDPKILLPEVIGEISNEFLLSELKLDIKQSRKKNWSDKDNAQRLQQFRLAYTYRYLKKHGKEKIYSGFHEFCLLSSGIVRRFLMLCAEAFEIAEQRKIDVQSGNPIPVNIQNEASRNVSKRQFLRIERNCGENGRLIMQLCEDIGVILRAKLDHSSTPEACRIELRDPQSIIPDSTLHRILETSQKWSLFQTEEIISYRPKGRDRPMPSTFILNRIYAPYLDISPRARWRTTFSVADLEGLLTSNKRAETLKNLTPSVSQKIPKKKPSSVKQQQRSLLDMPIQLSHCPVTGGGCNQHLLDMSDKKICFLASPFQPSGRISDARRLIKQTINEDLNIPCYDIGDYPQLGFLLCKICSCVRTYNFGLFEISNINRNVMFELGMAVGLKKYAFMLFCEKLSNISQDKFPPPPLEGIEYVPYEVSRNNIKTALKEKIVPRIQNEKRPLSKRHCSFMAIDCPEFELQSSKNTVFLGVPRRDDPYFQETLANGMRRILEERNLKVKYFSDASEQNDLCEICKAVRSCDFAIIDTSEKYENVTMSFTLGLVFGTNRPFIQTHNTDIELEYFLSDTSKWCIRYSNEQELLSGLNDRISKLLNK